MTQLEQTRPPAGKKPVVGLVLLLAITLAPMLNITSLHAAPDREQQQARLDADCEVAREKKLAPLREQFIAECVRNKEQPDRAACEAFYADYGAQSGNRAPLFYDLPECVAAFEYQQSERED